jgi:serine protease Do
MLRTLVFGLALTGLAGAALQAQQTPPTPPPAPKDAPIPPQNPALNAKPDPSKAALLQQLSTSLEGVTSQVGRAVVQIFARSYVPTQEAGSSDQLLTSQNSSGSGVILTADGYILTNSHVVSGARSLRVQLPDTHENRSDEAQIKHLGRSLAATVIGIDRNTDLALIKIDRNNLPYLTLGDSSKLKQGQIVLALGNPLGLENSVSMGVVSAVARQLKPDDFMTYVQTDAPINPGNSGGPLVDTEGHVVGIDTFIMTQSGGSEGIGFAIPSNIARLVYTQLRKYGHVHRAELGIVAQAISPAMADGLELSTDQGIIVSDVNKDGPGDHAGLKEDDIIVAINGRRVTTPRQLEYNLYRQGPGSTITLTVQRGEQRMDLFATPEEHPDPFDALADLADPTQNIITPLGIIGLNITPKIASMLSDMRRPAGVLVAASTAAHPYSVGGLKTGDVIYSVNRKVVGSIEELRSAVSTLHTGDSAVLQVQREDSLVYVALELE